MLARMRGGQGVDGDGVLSRAVVDWGWRRERRWRRVSEGVESLRSRNRNATAQQARPAAMTGTLRSRIRRRPMRSMLQNATRVKRKFVMAMESEVRVGDSKPTS